MIDSEVQHFPVMFNVGTLTQRVTDCIDINGVDRGAATHEQSIAFDAAETQVRHHFRRMQSCEQ